MNETVAADATFGAFALDEFELALPIGALREVVSANSLIPLPCPAKCVIGGIRLRGMLIPVVDLRIVFDRPTPPKEDRYVVIIADGAALLGLLADNLRGIFQPVPGSLSPVTVADPTAAILLAGAQRDNATMVNILSVQALARLPQVPRATDNERARRERDEIAELAADASPIVPLVLMACNGMPLALAASTVHATLANPRIDGTSLPNLNLIAYDGVKVPVVDLLELCGHDRIDQTRDTMAIIIALEAGYVAFLISAILDVIPTRAADVKHLPAFALPRAGLFAGCLPVAGLPPAAAQRFAEAFNQFLVIDAEQLQTDAIVLALAGMNSGQRHPARVPQARGDTGTSPRRAMITFMLETERATPLDDVVEILSYQPGTERFATSGAMLGLMVDRDRPIPVLCLAQLSGEARSTPTASARVLVVESDGELVGFAVRSLNSIEQADWEPNARAQPLACFDARATDQLLPVVDLHALVASLRRQPPTAGNASLRVQPAGTA